MPQPIGGGSRWPASPSWGLIMYDIFSNLLHSQATIVSDLQQTPALCFTFLQLINCVTWQFLQRQRVLALWRDMVRALNSKPYSMLSFVLDQLVVLFARRSDVHSHHTEIHTPSTRAEMHRYAREEFERNKDVTDLVSPPYSMSWFIL